MTDGEITTDGRTEPDTKKPNSASLDEHNQAADEARDRNGNGNK